MEERNNEEEQDSIKEFLKEFDIIFKTKIPDITKDLPYICKVFNSYMRNIYVSTDKMKELDKLEDELKTDLIDMLDSEQIIQLQKVFECEGQIFSDCMQQSFTLGLSLALQLYSKNITYFKISKNNGKQKK